jgi:hypothetical protein
LSFAIEQSKHLNEERALHHEVSTRLRHATADKNNGTAGFFVGSTTLERMRFDLEIFRRNKQEVHIKRMVRLVHDRQVEEMEQIVRQQAISTQNKVRYVRRKNETTRVQLADKASLRWKQLVKMRDQELKM